MKRAQYFSALLTSMRELPGAGEVMTFSGIRREYRKYFFAFPLAMIFVNVQNLFLSPLAVTTKLSATTYTFLAFAAGAVLFLACGSDRNLAAASKITASIMAAGLAGWIILPAGTPSFCGALVMMSGLGGCISCSSFSFVFLLNNTERFFGSAMILLSISLLKLCFGLWHIPAAAGKIFTASILLSLFLCMISCEKKDYADRNENRPFASDPGVWLAVYVLLSYFTIRITGFYVPAFGHPSVSLIWSAVAVVPVLLCIAVQILFKRSIWTLCNVFFLSAVLSYVMWYSGEAEAAHVFSELKETGLLVTIYLIGCVTNKFCSFRMHKRLILICMTVVGLLYLGIDLLEAAMPGSSVSVVTASVLFAGFLLLSPAFSQYLFFADWSKELRNVCMTAVSQNPSEADEVERQVVTLDGTGLSPREKQTALLLLRGMTVRQAAAELGLTPSTVATYSKAIYKKLGINSRAELFIMFGGRRQ